MRRKCRLEQALEFLQAAINCPAGPRKRDAVIAAERHLIAWLAGKKTFKLPSGFAEVDEDSLQYCDKCFRKTQNKGDDLCYRCRPPLAPPEDDQRQAMEEALMEKYAPEIEEMKRKGVLKEYQSNRKHRVDGSLIGEAPKLRVIKGRKKKRHGGH